MPGLVKKAGEEEKARVKAIISESGRSVDFGSRKNIVF